MNNDQQRMALAGNRMVNFRRLASLFLGLFLVTLSRVAMAEEPRLIRGAVVDFEATEMHCSHSVVTIFPRAKGSWQDLIATAIAIAEATSSGGRRSVKVSITRDDTSGLDLPDIYHRLGEADYAAGQWLITVVKLPLSSLVLSAMAARDKLMGGPFGNRMGQQRAEAQARKLLRLPGSTSIPETSPSSYGEYVERRQIHIDASTEARTSLRRTAGRCP